MHTCPSVRETVVQLFSSVSGIQTPDSCHWNFLRPPDGSTSSQVHGASSMSWQKMMRKSWVCSSRRATPRGRADSETTLIEEQLCSTRCRDNETAFMPTSYVITLAWRFNSSAEFSVCIFGLQLKGLRAETF